MKDACDQTSRFEDVASNKATRKEISTPYAFCPVVMDRNPNTGVFFGGILDL